LKQMRVKSHRQSWGESPQSGFPAACHETTERLLREECGTA
jgi:hypothetical protein